jgi:hypothetical protein
MVDYSNNERVKRYLPRVEHNVGLDHYDTKAAQKDDLDSLSRIYDDTVQKDLTNGLLKDMRDLEANGKDRDSSEYRAISDLYWDVPSYIHEIRDRHLPRFAKYADLDFTKKLIDLRNAVKAKEVVKKKSKDELAQDVKKNAAAKVYPVGTKEYAFKIISEATAPLKEAAVERTRVVANEVIDRIKATLEENDFDPFKIVPKIKYKNVWDANYDMAKKADEDRARYLRCLKIANQGKWDYSTGEYEGRTYEWNEAARETYVAACVKATENHYDSYVHKMITKCPNAKTATFTSVFDVWSFSTLKIETTDGVVEKWNTKIMINQSKFGLLFNQWRTTLQK